MKCSASIRVKYDKNLHECLLPEVHERDRCSMALEKTGDMLIININSKDAVALRATMNSITQMLSIYESTGDKNG